MMDISRFLYSNVGAVRGPCREIGTLTVGNAWYGQFIGENTAWGEKAEDWLANVWFPNMNTRGAPFDLQMSLFLACVATDRDGDALAVLVTTEDGYPQVQFVPAHRIGTRKHGDPILKSGPYKGLRIQNGAIFNPAGRTVAWLVLGDQADGSADVYVSARDAHPMFLPDWFDQGRGLTSFAHAIKDLECYRDVKDWIAAGIRATSAISYVEKNEKGGPIDEAALQFNDSAETTPAPGQAPPLEYMEGGSIRYFRANQGSSIESLEDKRPSLENQAFLNGHLLRGIYAGLEWPFEFTWNPENIGGANSRMVIAKALRTIAKRQHWLLAPWLRLTHYGIAKAIKLEILPPSPEWFLWAPSLPQSVSVDAGYTSAAELAEYAAGFGSLADYTGPRGRKWKDTLFRRAKEREFARMLETETGVPASEILPFGKDGASAPQTEPVGEEETKQKPEKRDPAENDQ
jgi:hypothetical protein